MESKKKERKSSPPNISLLINSFGFDYASAAYLEKLKNDSRFPFGKMEMYRNPKNFEKKENITHQTQKINPEASDPKKTEVKENSNKSDFSGLNKNTVNSNINNINIIKDGPESSNKSNNRDDKANNNGLGGKPFYI